MNYSDETADEMTQLQDEIEAKDLWDLDSKIDQAMDALRCPPDDADVDKLSGGERRRVALCRLLLEQPELLLLDEPTNHLDAETTAWLEGHLRNYPGAILIVTHDRYFLDNVTGWILELDRGRGIPYEGNYSSWLTQKQKRLEQEGREDASAPRTLAREQEWIAASPRRAKPSPRRATSAMRTCSPRHRTRRQQTAQIVIPVAERLGQNVIDFNGLAKGFGDQLLIDGLNFKLPPGGIVGVIGPNGAGKTTLFRMITGQEKPDQGTIKIGELVHLGIRASRVWRRIAALVTERETHAAWPRDPDGAPLYSGAGKLLPQRSAGAASTPASPTPCGSIWPRRVARIGRCTWNEDGRGRPPIPRPGATSSWRARKRRPAIISPSWSTTRRRASPTSCVARTCYHATSVHRLLQALLGLPAPRYRHHRLILDAEGNKLSKSTQATACANCARKAKRRRISATSSGLD